MSAHRAGDSEEQLTAQKVLVAVAVNEGIGNSALNRRRHMSDVCGPSVLREDPGFGKMQSKTAKKRR